MSWQAVTFAGLGLVLVGGFWWYERTRPSARLVALVAALAALAIAGRLVFAPIPNVVATTDIALITGYSLGAGPGFAVGALAAPISNIWLGQGPWTAWQMAGWGLVGLGGAWLAVLAHRRLGRVGLATFCALAGLAYGALLDLSVMVTYGGEQSLDRYLALSARGLPFNIAHAAGNFVIALAAGPALVRMISRFRTRMQFTWRPAGALPLLLVAAAVAAGVGAGAPDPVEARRSSVSWLEATQNDDGGFPATPGQPSSPAMTGWVMLGLEAAGRNPLDTSTSGETPVSYLRSQVGRLRSVGDLERSILALTAAGLDPRRFAGHDLVDELRTRLDRDGSVDGQVNLTAFYALAMRSAGAEPGSLKRPASWLRRAQAADGGWGIQPEAPSEADSTGAALQGLIAAGARGSATARGAAWLTRAQRGAGGYALGGSGVINSQSTAWAIQGLLAAGAGGRNVDRGLSYLRRLRGGDGHYRYSATSDQTPAWVTAQVLMATERQPFPVPPVARATGTSASRANGPADDAEEQASQGTGGGSSPSSGGSEPASSGSTAAPSSTSGDGQRTNQGTPDEPVSSANAGADPGSGAEAPPGAEPATATAQAGEQAPVSVTYADPEADQGDSTTEYILIGLGVLALIGAGGFALSRRASS